MYHNVYEEVKGNEQWIVSKDNLDTQMKYLSENNFKTIFVEDIKKTINKNKTVVITFDDGYEDFYTNAFPIIKKYNIKANLYITTDYIGTKNHLSVEQLKEISNSGLVSIGSHTNSHTRLEAVSNETLKKELEESKKTLEELLDINIKTISYPYGFYDDSVINMAKEYYEYGLAIEYQIQDMKDYNKYAIKRLAIFGTHDLNAFKDIVEKVN